MNPIPITWCAAGGLALAVAGFGGGWTVRNWQRDSQALASLNKATKAAEALSQQALEQGKLYEKGRDDEQAKSVTRETAIRTIYKDRAVPADCAVADAGAGVLDSAIAAANARASGQSGSGLPADQPSAAASSGS